MVVLLTFVLGLTACSDVPESPMEPRVDVRESPVQISSTPQAPYAAFLKIAERVPEFAGIYLDSNLTVTVMLTSLDQQASAARVVRELLVNRRPALDLESLAFRQARFSFRDLYATLSRARGRLMTAGSGIGISVRDNAVVVGSPTEDSDSELEKIRQEMGLEADAIRIIRASPARNTGELMGAFAPMIPAGAGIYRFVVSGLVVRCTASANAMFGNHEVFITAAHCSDTQGGPADNSVFYQGNYPNGGIYDIGHEIKDGDWFTPSENPECPPLYTKCRWADAAIVLYQNGQGRYGHFGYIATTGSGSTSGRGQFKNTTWWGTENQLEIVATYDDRPYEGEPIDRIGATTGWHYGTVAHPCWEVPSTRIAGHYLLCQTIVVDANAVLPEGGDSGGPAFRRMGLTKAIYAGVQWASAQWDNQPAFIFSSFLNVVADLGPLAVCTNELC
jgi:hypothetical protein